MPIDMQHVLEAMPRARREKIEAGGTALTARIMAASSLEQIRNALGKTQADVAARLDVKQHAISQLESRSDFLLSTLDKYLDAVGMKLELVARSPAGHRVLLENLQPWKRAGRQLPSAPAAGKPPTSSSPASRKNRASNTPKKTSSQGSRARSALGASVRA